MQKNYEELYKQKWSEAVKALGSALSLTKEHWVHIKVNSTDDRDKIFFSHILIAATRLEESVTRIFEDVISEFETAHD